MGNFLPYILLSYLAIHNLTLLVSEMSQIWKQNAIWKWIL